MEAITEHPAPIGEAYFQPVRTLFSLGIKALAVDIDCFLQNFLALLCAMGGGHARVQLHDRVVMDCGMPAKPYELLDASVA